MAYEYLPKELADLIGKEQEPRESAVAVERSLIDHWVSAFEDANPLYGDDEYAKNSEWESIVAPQGMLVTWTFPMYWTPAGGPVQMSERKVYFKVKSLLQMPTSVVVEYRGEWLKPVRLGDRLTYAEVVTDISPERTTRVGTGHFVSIEQIFRNKQDEIVAKAGLTLFSYGRVPKGG